MAFSVVVKDESGSTVYRDPELRLIPERWSDMVFGGPDMATIAMEGPKHSQHEALGWLYYEIQILGHDNTPAWWGYINEVSAGVIHCLGWWHMLDARYYENLKGKEEHVDGTATQDLGLGFSTNFFGAIRSLDILYEHEVKFKNFTNGIKFTVSGSSNDGVYTASGGASAEAQTALSGATIYFEASDDLRDTASGFKDFRANEYLHVDGSASNSGFHLVTSVATDHITTREGVTGVFTPESAGPTITLRQGNVIDVTGLSVGDFEIPGINAPVTVTAYGVKIAQSFQNNTGEAFTVARIGIKIQKVGSPTDAVTVALYDDSTGAPGSSLDSDTILAADITAQAAWHWADLANTQSIATSTDYWIVITRAGANDPDNFYRVTVDEDAGYASGVLKVWDGAPITPAWQDRPTDADLAFRVHGAVETTEQISAMITNNGQAFSTVSIFDDSGISRNQYRDGLTLTRTEVEDLLEQGTSGGEALKATVTSSKAIIIETQPDSGSPLLQLNYSPSTLYSTALDEVWNRVQVLYTYTDADGQSVSASTDWSANDDSVDRYGYRELRHSVSELTSTQADALRDRILAASAWPALGVEVGYDALHWSSGGPVDAGKLVAGEWLTIADAPFSESGYMVASPLFIVTSEFDARSGKLTIRPATTPDPWDVGGITQG